MTNREVISLAEEMLRVQFPKNLEIIDGPCVKVDFFDEKTIVGGKSTPEKLRALMLLAKAIDEGKREYKTEQTAAFDSFGMHLDVNHYPMQVEAVKRFMRYMAILGTNTIILYMEDGFKLEGYPYFGYQNGAYTPEELREIDEYGAYLGMTVIPHVELLGHMAGYLCWPAAAPVRDTADVLLCGAEETYDLIEAIVKLMRSCFRSKKLHIGCDEAGSVGEGAYKSKFGERDPFEIINEHLDKVVEICKKYDFDAMMYHDMYTRLGSRTGNLYDPDSVIPAEVVAGMPDAEIVYWDYGHTKESEYAAIIKKFRDFGKEVAFYGANWSWNDILPRYDYTIMATPPAMKACLHGGVKHVYISQWGGESDPFYTLFGLTMMSEFCYTGDTSTLAEQEEISEFVFGVTKEFFEKVGELSMPMTSDPWYGIDDTFMGRKLFFTDVLVNRTGSTDFYRDAAPRYATAREAMERCFTDERWFDLRDFAVTTYDMLERKARIISTIQSTYFARDMAGLNHIADELDALAEVTDHMRRIRAKTWYRDMKPTLWTTIDGHYGHIITREHSAAERLRAFTSGEVNRLEELDEILNTDGKSLRNSFNNIAQTKA